MMSRFKQYLEEKNNYQDIIDKLVDLQNKTDDKDIIIEIQEVVTQLQKILLKGE